MFGLFGMVTFAHKVIGIEFVCAYWVWLDNFFVPFLYFYLLFFFVFGCANVEFEVTSLNFLLKPIFGGSKIAL